MARETRLTLYDEQVAGAVDLDECGAELRSSDCSMPSTAAKDGLLPDDPIPLFLSGPAAETEEPDSGKTWNNAAISTRILRAGILAAIAVAIGFAFLPENPLALFANAKASLIGFSVAQSRAGATAPAVQSAADVQASSPIATNTPTRDEIAAAFKAARQNLAEIHPPPAAAPPPRHLDADELAALLKRARSLIAIGDIAAARLLLERAADAQEASAALLLARTYDPAVLGTPDARSITPDPAAARAWYQRAAQLGSKDAELRLALMQN